jgi:hypothetical protein
MAQFGVFKGDSEHTKVRLVNDASQKTSDGYSLNDLLFKGDNYLQDLVGILCRFRTSPFVMCADLEKAFLQVGLKEFARDCVRFLWLIDPTKPWTEDNLREMRFARVPFGCVTSPFMLGAVIDHLVAHFGSQALKDQVQTNCYMDNILYTFNTVAEGIVLHKESRELFKSAKMNLRDFTTNCTELRESFESGSESKQDVVSVLGLWWDIHSDTIRIKAKLSPQPYTKRGILRFLAKTFDPLGLFSPVLIVVKVLLQDIWKLKLKWDEVISPALGPLGFVSS